MSQAAPFTDSAELEALVRPFEQALIARGERDLARFLPPKEHPLFAQVLCELIRIDLEYGWEYGQVRRLAEYRERFPDFFADRQRVAEVAFEEYRLRRRFGDEPSPRQYADEWHIDTSRWPASRPEAAAHPDLSPEETPTSPVLVEAARRYRQLCDQAPPAAAAERLEKWCRHSGHSASAQYFGDLHRRSPRLAQSVAQGLTRLPEVGRHFLDFFLVAELGRGAFGRVFLARQPALANRPVALKIAPNAGSESQTLAQLQHTHIVPIYSVHSDGPLQAVCMPYFGRLTLADVTRSLRGRSSLPQTGIALLTTLHEQRTREWLSQPTPAASAAAPTDAQPHQQQAARSVIARLQGWSYVEAVLWLGGCLADGLAHAHERGIEHRDLKPANVLITDEGVPMLLDFNLAEDVKLRGSAAAAAVGGTLPYMAPEQLDAFRGGDGKVDARADLFSLGVVLFELLTGRLPWDEGADISATRPGGGTASVNDVVDHYYRQHCRPAASVRAYNRLASPATAAIVRHCLEPDPARRYQTARQLHEDLQRQLESRPLRYAPDRSLAERGRKLVRRSPQLLPRVAAAAALCAAVGLGYYAYDRWQREAEADREARQLQALSHAGEAFAQFRRRLHGIHFDLNIQDDHERLQRGRADCRDALERYGVLDDADWRERPDFALLPDDERRRLEGDVGDLLLQLVRTDLLARTGEAASLPEQDFARLLALNHEAERCLCHDGPSPAVLSQRADLYQRRGDTATAKQLRQQAERLPLATAQDFYFRGRDLRRQGRTLEALPLLQEAARLDPQSYWANFHLAICFDELGNGREAAARYSVCIGIDPNLFGAWFNRGAAHFRDGRYPEAIADFSAAIDRQPREVKAYINRGLAYQNYGQQVEAKQPKARTASPEEMYRKAVADLSLALDLGARETRIYFFRARARAKLGDEAGAKQDHAEGMKREPSDELSYNERGLMQLGQPPSAADAERALADLRAALKINPRYGTALSDMAFVYSEVLKDNARAIECLDRLLELQPDSARAYGSRGVLHARAGRDELAYRDAETALQKDAQPQTLYQSGCVYALTARRHAPDAGRAVHLIEKALRGGYGAQFLADDPDLEALRDLPQFQKLRAKWMN